jgi:exodeoxyribonuclease VII small subunit
MPNKKESIKESMNKLENIVGWFEKQDEIDVEEGLKKVGDGASLIKRLKDKLKQTENEFVKIKKSLDK